MRSAEEALNRLCNPEAEVSAHYTIDEDGTIYQLVADDKRAWHAGRGYWRGQDNINNVSIGIELVNPGHEFGYRPFPEAQMQALIPLCQQLLRHHPIPPHNVIGHSDLAPLRKTDPGELFDWKRLAEHGIGLWAETPVLPEECEALELLPEDIGILQERLAAFGYFLAKTGCYDEDTEAVIRAFKRHFLPQNLNSEWNRASERRLSALLPSP
jgi:N-acetylmuramoyl-L-alanine amidase